MLVLIITNNRLRDINIYFWNSPVYSSTDLCKTCSNDVLFIHEECGVGRHSAQYRVTMLSDPGQ